MPQLRRKIGGGVRMTASVVLVALSACHKETEMAMVKDAPAGAPVQIELEGVSNDWDYPVLKIHLSRDGRNAGHLYVRMPEGINARDRAANRAVNFYQDTRDPAWPATLECEPLGLPVTWTGTSKNLRYTIEFDNGMVLKSRAEVLDAAVRISYQLANKTQHDLEDLIIWTCVQLRPVARLRDPLMKRTAVAVGGRFQLMCELIPHFAPYSVKAAGRQRFTAYAPGEPLGDENPKVLPHPGFRDDPDQAISFWHVPKHFDVPVIATVARDGTWSVATCSENARRVWTNPVISCQHADPVIPTCPLGATAASEIEIVFVEGGLDELTSLFLHGQGSDPCP